MSEKLSRNVLIAMPKTSQLATVDAPFCVGQFELQLNCKLSVPEKQNAKLLKEIPNQTFHIDRTNPVQVLVMTDDGNLDFQTIQKKNGQFLETGLGLRFHVPSGRALDGSVAHVWMNTPSRGVEYRRQKAIKQILEGLPSLPEDLQVVVALEAGMCQFEATWLRDFARLEASLKQQSLVSLEKLAKDVRQAATDYAGQTRGAAIQQCA
jgi:hypothetical protein